MSDQADDNLPDETRPAVPSVGKFRAAWNRIELGIAGSVCLVALLLVAGTWWQQQSQQGGLIEIDRATRQQAAFQVDINQADWAELAQLPDIGEATARQIVEHRESQGPFTSREDLQRVRGIGPKTMERLRPYLLPLAEPGTVAGENPKYRMTNDEGS